MPQPITWPHQPVVYDLVTRLVLTTQEPYRTHVVQVAPGQSLRLAREPEAVPGCGSVPVLTLAGQPVGRLSADTASYVSILLANAQDLDDRSYAERILLCAPPCDPSARRLRYPKLWLHLALVLPSAWPLFVIAAVLGLKTADFASRFNLEGNPWLAPVLDLAAEYRRLGHDAFRLPPDVAAAWIEMTAATPGLRALTNPDGDDKITR